MVAPCLEVLMFDVGTHTIDDPSTPDGQKWREVFYGLPKAPGFIRAGFGRNVGLDGGRLEGGRITILVDWETRADHFAFMAAHGTISPYHVALNQDRPIDLYHIVPSQTSSGHSVYKSSLLHAPYVTLSFFWGIENESAFARKSVGVFEGLAGRKGCVGYEFGEVMDQVRSDGSGNLGFGGKGGVLVVGWRSKVDAERVMSGREDVFEELKGVVGKVEGWGVRLEVVEKSGDVLVWKRVEDISIEQ